MLSDGAVILPAQKFIALLKTYKGTRLLNFEFGPAGLRIQNFTMPAPGHDPNPKPPADSQVFSTSDAPTPVQTSGDPSRIR